MNDRLSRSVRRAAQTAARASIAVMVITLVACGGGGSGGGGKRPPIASAPPTSMSPTPPAPPPAAPGAPPATVLTLSSQSVKTFSFSWLAVGSATEYRLLEDPNGTGFVQIASMSGDVLSHDLPVFLPSKINARYVLQSCNSAGCAPSATVSVTRDTFIPAIGYVKPSNTVADPSDGVPSVVASSDVLDFSADGNTLVFSVPQEDGIGTGINGDQSVGADRTNNSGAVYVLVRNAGVWSQQAYIKASDSRPGLYFGTAVSLSADGNTLAVGAPEEPIGGGTETADPRGKVYVFVRSNTNWSEQSILAASNADQDDRFGFYVSLADDGNTLAVAAPTEDSNGSDPNDNSVKDSGAAYVFTRSGTTWRQSAFLKASNTLELNLFGGALSLSGDGQTLAIGATDEDSAPGGDPMAFGVDNSGAAYVFVRNGDDTWTQQALLKASNAKLGDSLGTSLSLSRDGRTLAIGAPATNARNGVTGAGSAYIFVRGDNNAWTQQNILAIAGSDNDSFGTTVSLSDDGNTLVVGAIGESSAAKGFGSSQTDNSEPGSGAAYVFTRNGTNWSAPAFIKASNAQSGDSFGTAVAVTSDGSTVAVLAPGEASVARGVGGNQNDESARAGGGAVYLY